MTPVIGDEYDQGFKEKYILIMKKAYFLIRLLYSLSPASNEDPAQMDKAFSVIKNLKALKDEIKVWLYSIVEEKKVEAERAVRDSPEQIIAKAKYRRYEKATDTLMKMIRGVENNLRKLQG